MPLINITTTNHDLVAPYRCLKDKELAHNFGLFIAEGPYLVERLLESNHKIHSVLISQRHASRFSPQIPNHINTLIADENTLADIVGFKFHRGILACAHRPQPATLNHITATFTNQTTLLICPEINDPENLGSLFRLAAGFGINAIILGPSACDPFRRRCLRVSMGTVFKLPFYQSQTLLTDMHTLQHNHHIKMFGSVVGMNATPLKQITRPPNIALLLGNEADGLTPDYINACDQLTTIPMHLGTDSLNVAVAAGIYLYHFCSK